MTTDTQAFLGAAGPSRLDRLTADTPDRDRCALCGEVLPTRGAAAHLLAAHAERVSAYLAEQTADTPAR